MPHCLDPGTVKQITVVEYDGQNWEKSMEIEKSKLAAGKPNILVQSKTD